MKQSRCHSRKHYLVKTLPRLVFIALSLSFLIGYHSQISASRRKISLAPIQSIIKAKVKPVVNKVVGISKILPKPISNPIPKPSIAPTATLTATPIPTNTPTPSPQIEEASSNNQYFNTYEGQLLKETARAKVSPVTDLSITKIDQTLKLSWSKVKGALFYKVYRATDPYFYPTRKNLIAYTIRTTYTDKTEGIVGDPEKNYFYVVTAVGRGGESDVSNRVGEFDFALRGRLPDRTDDFFSLPLKTSDFVTADSLAAYIGDVYMIFEVLAGNNIVWRLPGLPAGTNFSVQLGHTYGIKLNIDGIKIVTFVGGVPSPDEVKFNLFGGENNHCEYNSISLPFSKSNITTAAELEEDIEDVTQILFWDSILGTKGAFHTYEPENPFSENFAVRIGYPYFLCMRKSKTWPTNPAPTVTIEPKISLIPTGYIPAPSPVLTLVPITGAPNITVIPITGTPMPSPVISWTPITGSPVPITIVPLVTGTPVPSPVISGIPITGSPVPITIIPLTSTPSVTPPLFY